MIHCPKCGAANRRGSRFCNECGEALPMRTALRCPMCGTMNPVGNVYCDRCHARLIPMAALPSAEPEAEPEQAPIKGPSLSTIPLEEQRERAAEDKVTGTEPGGVDWLSDLSEPGVTAETGAIEEAEAEEAADWLAQLRATEVTGETEAVEEVETGKTEDWLAALREDDASKSVEARVAGADETGDWLAEFRDAALEEAEEPEPAVPVEAVDIPDWLRDMGPIGSDAEAAPPAPEPAPPVVEAVPEGVSSVRPLVEFPVETEISEAPDWLSELEAEPLPTPAPAAPALEGIAFAEIPDWMQAMRPRPAQAEAIVEEEPLETGGLLRGLRGVITPAFAIEAPLVGESAVPPEVREAGLSRAQLLQSLLAQPDEISQPKPLMRGPRVSERIQRWLVAIVLIATAILIVLTAPGISMFYIPPLTQPAAAPESSQRMDLQHLMGTYDTIQGLSLAPGESVLAAFEYGPTEADELNLVAEPLLRHLLGRGAHISIVSTRPEGMTVAAGLLERIVESDDQYTKDQYSLTNYRPGNATGVSQLLVSPGTPPNLILVLTAQPGPLRWWIEQTQAQGEDAPPMVAGVSAALEPAAGPYLAGAGKLKGAVSGLGGAAVYERKLALSDSDASATRQLNALAVGHTAIVALIIVGAVLYALSGLRRREE